MKLSLGVNLLPSKFNFLRPLFAASILELTNKFGVGSYPSAIRNSTGTFKMYDSVAGSILKTAQINEHRVNGCREVVNLLSHTEDLTAVGFYDPNSFVVDANTVHFDGSASSASKGYALTSGDYVYSYEAWTDSGTHGINVKVWSPFGAKNAIVTADTVRKRFLIRFTITADTNVTTYIKDSAAPSVGDVHIDKRMIVNVTGLDPNYVPEYVPNLGTGTARKLFDTTNGNTVLNNVVTEAAGVPLHPKTTIDDAPWYLTKPDWTAGVAYAAGAEVNHSGKWYSTVAGGTDAATFGDTVTWVDQGLYTGIGLLDEGSSTQYSRQDIVSWFYQGASSGGGTLVNEIIGLQQHYLYDGNASATGNVIQWCKVKATIGSPIIQLRPVGLGFGVAFASFDLSTNTIVGSGGSAYVTSRISSPDSNGDVICEMVANYAVAPTGSMVAFTNNGAVELPSYTGIGAQIDVAWAQTEPGAVRTSEIPNTSSAPATRANEMGNIKWSIPSSFNHLHGYYVLDIDMAQYTVGDQILSLNGAANSLLYVSASNTLAMTDGTSVATVGVTAGKIVRVIGTWDTNMQLSSLDLQTHGAAWVDGTAVAYDGGFTSGANISLCDNIAEPVSWRNTPVIYGEAPVLAGIKGKFA